MENNTNNTNITANTNANIDLFNERIKFYADTPLESNKYFCYKITSILALQEALWRFFDKGWNIRSAWYEKINISSGEVVVNKRLDIPTLLSAYCQQKIDKKKRLH